MTTEPTQPMSIFLCYHQKDEAFKQEFEDYLIILQDTGLITGWAERQVQQRLDWSQQPIDPRLSQANLYLLFVSPSLVASGYCSGAEFLEMFERQRTQKEVVLIPIILRPVNFSGYLFEMLQYLPRNGRAVSSWIDRNEVWRDVDRGIRGVIRNYSWSYFMENSNDPGG
jgi:hypothetical protein